MKVLRSAPFVAGLLTLTGFAVAGPVAAQSPPAQAVTPALDFSGVIYANFQRRMDSLSKLANAGKAASKFDVERVYLNFRMPAGDRASIRVTTDIFNGDQSSTSYYKGWTVRIKYAYLQWNVANNIGGKPGLNATLRFGMLHNTVIDHIESFWPRYLSQTDVERTAGFFSSADLGAAVLVTLPSKLGEVYANVVNGPGYTTAENDRFKDFGARLSLTPFANGTALGNWGKSLVVTPWFYQGKTASKFQNGGTGQVGLVPEGLKRNRYGVFLAARDPRLTFGVSYAKGTATSESGDNTTASPRIATDVDSRVQSAFAVIRPMSWKDPSKPGRFGILGRFDDFKPNVDSDAKTQFTIASLFYDVTSKVTASLDYQLISSENAAGVKTEPLKGLFLHWNILF